MDLREFFTHVGGNYDEVISRLLSEKFVLKYILKFKSDTSCENLKNAFADEDYSSAFRAAHTLKGMCSTLGFGDLFKYSSELTETLRNQDNIDIEKAKQLLKIVIEKNDLTLNYINQL